MRAANKPGQSDGALNRMLSRNCVLAVGVPMDLRITFHFSSSFSPVPLYLSAIFYVDPICEAGEDKIPDSSGVEDAKGSARGRSWKF